MNRKRKIYDFAFEKRKSNYRPGTASDEANRTVLKERICFFGFDHVFIRPLKFYDLIGDVFWIRDISERKISFRWPHCNVCGFKRKRSDEVHRCKFCMPCLYCSELKLNDNYHVVYHNFSDEYKYCHNMCPLKKSYSLEILAERLKMRYLMQLWEFTMDSSYLIWFPEEIMNDISDFVYQLK